VLHKSVADVFQEMSTQVLIFAQSTMRTGANLLIKVFQGSELVGMRTSSTQISLWSDSKQASPIS
jgi:hypothetical protein